MTDPRSVLMSLTDIGLSLASRAGLIDILRDIQLTLYEGESVAILGPSGSGKTSLLMVMVGLELASKGRVAFDGAELTRMSEDELALLRGSNIGIVFQSFNLVPTLTALENVALPLEFAGASDAAAQASDRLAEVGLAHRLHHFPAELSGGERQRVAIARALAPRPRLLLADEPTGNLDSETGRQIIDLLFDLHGTSGTTLVLVTHDTALASRCRRVV